MKGKKISDFTQKELVVKALTLLHEAISKDDNEKAEKTFELSFDIMNIWDIETKDIANKICKLMKRRK